MVSEPVLRSRRAGSLQVNRVTPPKTINFAARPRSYTTTTSKTWWLRKRAYFVYVLRDLSPTAGVLWLLAFLYEIRGLRSDPSGYSPFHSPLFVAFSSSCLAATLFHAFTWFRLTGIATPLRLGGRVFRPIEITIVMYATFVLVSVLIGWLLIRLAA